MRSKSTYHLQRYSKVGEITNEEIIDSIVNSEVITAETNSRYAFTKVTRTEKYIFAYLTKFFAEDQLNVVDEKSDGSINTVLKDIQNLVKAESPFILIPSKSVIAHQHVWNEIKPETFVKVFCELYYKKNNHFFSDLIIDPIVDMRSFISKLQEMTSISLLKAKIHPSNPYWSKYWNKVDSYLKSRNAQEMIISEESKNGALNTVLPALTKQMLDNSAVNISDLSFTELGIIMATDGYGDAEIHGVRNDMSDIIKTKDTHCIFSYDREPNPDEFYSKVMTIVNEIELARGLHEK